MNKLIPFLLIGSISASVYAEPVNKYAIIADFLPVAQETHKVVAPQLPFSMPYIAFVDIPLEGPHCNGKCLRVIAGYYLKGVVYLSNKLDWTKEENKALFAHEMTHYFQDELNILNNPNQNICTHRKKMEKQAFLVQMDYMKARNIQYNPNELDDLIKASTKVVCH